MAVFDINGNNIGGNPFLTNALVESGVYKNVQYYYIRINKKKYDGIEQHPFVIAPNGTGGATQSALQYASTHKYPIVVNAGAFDIDNNSVPRGILIVDSTVLKNESYSTWEALTIDENGNLSSVPSGTDATTLTGIVSACCGVGGTLVNNYVGKTIDDYSHPGGWSALAQRMIIGQFGNGDYAIIACEGRNFDNSVGWTVGDEIDFCKSINLKFAFNLDGGGSTELVVGKKQLNTIYDGTYGRIVPTFIVFNGSTTYGEPEE